MGTYKWRVAAWVVLAALATTATADSVWSKANGSLFSDNKAYRVGDIVTVIVNEGTTLSSSAGTSLSKESDTSGEISAVDWPKGVGAAPVLPGDPPKVEFGAKRSFGGSGTSSLANSMQTNLTAVVMEVLPNGNLVIDGSRIVQLVNEEVVVKVSGIVRPQDINTNNAVLSSALAQGKIVIENNGPIARSTERGFLNKIIDFIWPF